MVYSLSYFEYFYAHTLPNTDKVTLPSEFGRDFYFIYFHLFIYFAYQY